MNSIYRFFRGLAADVFDLVTVEIYQDRVNAFHQVVTEKWKVVADREEAASALIQAYSDNAAQNATINGLRQSLSACRRRCDDLVVENAILAQQVKHLQGLVDHEAQSQESA